MNSEPLRGRGVSLVGYRGTGKSTAGRLLAARLGLTFLDADAELEHRLGRSIRSVFEEHGEAAFRDHEQAVIADLTSGPPAVIATGGGVVLRESNRRALRRFGTVVWLRAEPSVLAARLNSAHALSARPALTTSGTIGEIAEVLAARLEAYRAAADLEVDTGGRTPAEVVGSILEGLRAGARESGVNRP
jgi:shikimate kinase